MFLEIKILSLNTHEQNFAHSLANIENWGSPQTSHKQHYYKLPQHVLVLSSHTYSARGRFLISKDTFVAFCNFVYLCCFKCVCFSLLLFTWCLLLATKNPTDFFDWKCTIFVLCTTIWLQVEEFATLNLIGWKSLCCIFKIQSGHPTFSYKANQNACLFSNCIVRMKTRCWCQISTIRTFACRWSKSKFCTLV